MRKHAIFALFLAGCGPSAPDKPTWVDDVQPVVMANCARCHGYPAANGAPATFRLDVYESTVANGRFILGARAMARFMCVRGGHRRGDMPPRGASIGGRSRDIFASWFQSSAGDCSGGESSKPELGSMDGNDAPEISVEIRNRAPDDRLNVDYVVTDPERDAIIGALELVDGGGTVVATQELHNGKDRLSFDTGVLAAGVYKVRSTMTDGAPSRTMTKEHGEIEVRHFFQNAAPRIELLAAFAPKVALREDIVNPNVAPVEVRFNVSDADGARDFPLSYRVCAIQGDQRTDVTPMGCTSFMTQIMGTGAAQVTVPVDGASLRGIEKPEDPPVTVRFEVAVRDGKMGERTVTSPYLIVSKLQPSANMITFTKGGPLDQGVIGQGGGLLGGCGECHGGGASGIEIPDLAAAFTIDVDHYDQIVERKALLYRRVVQLRDMPPESTVPLVATAIEDLISEEQRRLLAIWLLSGAPR